MSFVKQLIASIIDSYLGPNKSCKSIIDSQDQILTKCPLQLLQNADYRDPFILLTEEALEAHHKRFGCCTMSLLAMTYFWIVEFQNIIQMGCEICDITSISRSSLEHVISSIQTLSIPTHKLFSFINNDIEKNIPRERKCESKVQKYLNFGRLKLSDTLNPSSDIPIGLRFSSRHYSPFQASLESSEMETVNEKSNIESIPKIKELSKDVLCGIRDIVFKLSHDDPKSAHLVSLLWIQQIQSSREIKFDDDGIFILPITMPCFHSSVVEGLIIKSNVDISWLDSCNLSNSRMLIINGDITYEYVHLGFAPKVSIVKEKLPEQLQISEKQVWVTECCDLLSKLEINILLIKGQVDEQIKNFCCLHSILLLSGVSWTTLKMLCKILDYSPPVYLADCNSTSVRCNVSASRWILESNPSYFVQINVKPSSNSAPLQSVIVCHPSTSVLEMEQHQLLHLISRLRLAIQDKKVLPGGGRTEQWAAQILNQLQNSKKDPECMVIRAIANGFEKYFGMIQDKMKLHSHSSEEALDVHESKIHAWHSSLLLGLMIIQCDIVVVNCNEDEMQGFKLSDTLLGCL